MKKLIALLLVVLLGVFALAACDSDNAPENPEHTHTFDQKNVGDNYLKSGATVDSPAVYYYSCQCGEKGTETFAFGNALSGNDGGDGEHIYRDEWTYDDEKHWIACIDLSCDVRKQEAKHTFGDWVIDEEPTCTREGTKSHSCVVCGKSVSETIPVNPTDHHYATTWTRDDTNHWYKCQNSGCTSVREKSAHNFGEWIVDKAATCVSTGTRHHVCTVCSKSISETIPVNPTAHNYATTWTVDGTNHWYKCQNSGCASTLEKSAHTWDKENTCTVCQKYKDDGVKFTKQSDETYKVDDYVGGASEVIIPSTYYGIPVTSIDDYAFWDCSRLTSITIPDSVTSIGAHAFEDCTSLSSVTFGENSQLTSIGNSAFWDCSRLTSITIPDSVTSIGSSAFYGCSNLTSITLPFVGNTKHGTSNTHFGYIWGASSGVYNKAFVPSSLKTVVITGGESIGHVAFWGCSSLTSIAIPDSVTSIGEGAFYNCTALTSITIPAGVTSIGGGAFSYCESLTSITIPDGVTSIGWTAFYGCTSLTSITIPDSVTSIGDSAFYDCESLTSITFGGTKAQWENISKGFHWIYGTPTITVTCTDRTITI